MDPTTQAALIGSLSALGGSALTLWGSHLTQKRTHSSERDEQLRDALAELLVNARERADNLMLLAPAYAKFEQRDWNEWVETDSGKRMGELNRAHKSLMQRARLVCPAGPLRDALWRYASLDDWEVQGDHPLHGLLGAARNSPSGAAKEGAVLDAIGYAGSLLRSLDTVEAQAIKYFSRST